MRLLFGDAFVFLDEIEPSFIVTDSNPETIGPLIRWCEHHHTILVNAYSTRWLTALDRHPAQKRIEPYEALIRAFPNEPVVCDPFMGSGSIGEAALRCGRDFIGIEKMQQWFVIAEARLHGFQNAAAGTDRAVG
jgi:DNA modification methylase